MTTEDMENAMDRRAYMAYMDGYRAARKQAAKIVDLPHGTPKSSRRRLAKAIRKMRPKK